MVSSGLALPDRLSQFVFAASGWNQLFISILATIVFLLNMAPLELQRRIIAAAVKDRPFEPILGLCVVYVVAVAAFGLIKLLTNVYSGWIGESATRALRVAVDKHLAALPEKLHLGDTDAVGASMILAECEDVGSFVGNSVSEPVLQGGFLLTLFVYLGFLQPWMALAGLAMLLPQLIFVPLLQGAINNRVSRRITLMRQVGFEIISAGENPEPRGDLKKLDTAFEINMGIFRYKYTLNFLMNLTYSLGLVSVLGVGGWLVVHGQTEIATVVTFASALTRIIDPWNDLVDWWRSLVVSGTKYALIVKETQRLEKAVG